MNQNREDDVREIVSPEEVANEALGRMARVEAMPWGTDKVFAKANVDRFYAIRGPEVARAYLELLRRVDALAGEVEKRINEAELDRLREENEGLRGEVRRLRGELDAANREVAFGAWGGYGGTEGESDERTRQ